MVTVRQSGLSWPIKSRGGHPVSRLDVCQPQAGVLPGFCIAPASGSLAGGTLITIEGVNFDRDLYGTRTKVFVGASDCPLKHFYSSENRVVCTTPPRSIESTENVTLFQNDVEIPGSVAYR